MFTYLYLSHYVATLRYFVVAVFLVVLWSCKEAQENHNKRQAAKDKPHYEFLTGRAGRDSRALQQARPGRKTKMTGAAPVLLLLPRASPGPKNTAAHIEKGRYVHAPPSHTHTHTHTSTHTHKLYVILALKFSRESKIKRQAGPGAPVDAALIEPGRLAR